MRWIGPLCALAFVAMVLGPGAWAQPPASSALYERADPAGDASAGATGAPASPVGVPEGLVGDAVDIRFLRVDAEDPVRLDFSLTMADLGGLPRLLDAGRTFFYRLDFSLAQPAFEFTLAASFNGHEYALASAGGQSGRIDGYESFRVVNEGSSCSFSGLSAFDVWADLEADAVRFNVPKAMLLGRAGYGCSLLDEGKVGFEVGDKLVGLRSAAVSSGVAIFGLPSPGLVDEAPDVDETPDDYEIRHATPNVVVALSSPFALSDGDPSRQPPTLPDQTSGAGVPIGGSVSIPVTIHNTAVGKRLVNLTAEVTPGASGWTVRAIPGIEVPANGKRTVAVVVNASATLEHRNQTVLTVRGVPVGRPDELGLVTIPLRATAVPTPQWQTLYFHGAPSPSSGDEVADVAIAAGLVGAFDRIWMNGLKEDPAGALDSEGIGGETNTFQFLGEGRLLRAGAPVDTGATGPFRIETSEPVAASVGLKAARELDVTVTATLMLGAPVDCPQIYCKWYGDLTLGAGSATARISPTATAVPVSIVVDPAASLVAPEDGILGLQVVVETQDPVAAVPSSMGVRWVPAQSSLSLPLVATGAAAEAGSDVGLYAQGDREEFLNPGKTRLFPVLVVNQAQTERRIVLEASTPAEGWNTSLRPGRAFLLPAGGSVNVTLIVQAPASATEGEAASISVAALADGAKEAASLEYTAIVTRGVELEDEADDYREDPEAVAHAVPLEPTEDSPWPVWAAVAALAAALWVRRRESA